MENKLECKSQVFTHILFPSTALNINDEQAQAISQGFAVEAIRMRGKSFISILFFINKTLPQTKPSWMLKTGNNTAIHSRMERRSLSVFQPKCCRAKQWLG